MRLVKASKIDRRIVNNYFILNDRFFNPEIERTIEENRAMVLEENGVIKAFICILGNKIENGELLGKIMLNINCDISDEIMEQICQWIKYNRKHYDRFVIYKAPKDKVHIFKKEGFNIKEDLIVYEKILEKENFKVCNNLEKVSGADLKEINSLDCRAFDKIWRENKNSLYRLLTNEDNNFRFIALKDEGKIVAFAFYRYRPHIGEGYLNRMAVDPSYQGKGIGKMLLEDALNWFKKKGAETVRLTTQCNNEKSVALYKNYGFKPVDKSIVITYK